jgi:hypothetical protein
MMIVSDGGASAGDELTASIEVPRIAFAFDSCDDLDIWVGGVGHVFDGVPSLF